jgi:hypothetical protein
MRQKLLNRLLLQLLQLKRKQHVVVLHLLRWVQSVTVKCKALANVMQHAVVMQIFAKNKQVQ